MRLLVLVVLAGMVAGCWGPSSGYVEPAAPRPDPVHWGQPTPGTPEPPDTAPALPAS